MIWIEVKEHYSGKEGILLAGHTYQVSPDRLKRIQADRKLQKQKPLRFKKTCVPWDRGKQQQTPKDKALKKTPKTK